MNKVIFSRSLLILTTIFLASIIIILTNRYLGPLSLSLSSTVSQKQTLFTAQGESEIVTVPDQAELSLGVSISDASLATAQKQANQIINSLTQELKKLGVKDEDLKTQNYSIYPEYDYQSPSRKITAYNVNISLQVKLTDFDKLNQVVDLATAQGANQVGGVNFSLSKEKEQKLKEQARREAIADAKDSAEELAGLAGVKLGRVVDVQEIPNSSVVPMYALSDARGGAEAMDKSQIEAGSTTYSYGVILSYEVK